MDDYERIGGRVALQHAEDVLGFQPEVGETFFAGGLKLRVLSRTIGLDSDDDGDEYWFDVIFVATVDPIDDAEDVISRLKGLFESVDDGEGHGPDDELGDGTARTARADDHSSGGPAQRSGDSTSGRRSVSDAGDEARDGTEGPRLRHGAGDSSGDSGDVSDADAVSGSGIDAQVIEEIEEILRAA